MNKEFEIGVKRALGEVHCILADFYDEELERNEKNAKINVSRVIRILKEKIEEINIEDLNDLYEEDE